MCVYPLVRNVLFAFDSENIHDAALRSALVFRAPPLRSLVASLCQVHSAKLHTTVAGLTFANPVGLAAGFDKPGSAVDMISAFGFGSLELGTVTLQPQEGNPKPRIFRYPRDNALVNRMGFPSPGVEALLPNLRRIKGAPWCPVIGVNIGKNKVTPLDDAQSDYVELFTRVRELADYVAINVSSPNTPQLRQLQEPQRLMALFEAIEQHNERAIPVWVKLAPDLEEEELQSIVEVLKVGKVHGVIATNTTIDSTGVHAATVEKGGVSGVPLQKKALQMVSRLHDMLEGSLPIIGVGGISSPQAAEDMIRAGASLVQVYTGLVYEGPSLVKRINKHLLQVVEAESLHSIAELVGRGK